MLWLRPQRIVSAVLLQSESPTIADALELHELDCRARRLAPTTRQFYADRLKPFLAFCEAQEAHTIADLTPALIRRYVAGLQARGLAAHTVHGHARALRTLCLFLVSEGLLEASPMVRMPQLPKTVPPALSVEDARALLDACETERDKAIVLFLLDTGLRAAELIALDGADVDLAGGLAHVRLGKGSKNRTVYFGAHTAKQLRRYYLDAGRPSPNEAVFRSERTAQRLTTNGLRQMLQRLRKRAMVPYCTPHTFRRTFALWSLRSGMSIYHLQRLMGHEDISTLRRYLALVDDDLRAAHARFGAVDRWLAK